MGNLELPKDHVDYMLSNAKYGQYLFVYVRVSPTQEFLLRKSRTNRASATPRLILKRWVMMTFSLTEKRKPLQSFRKTDIPILSTRGSVETLSLL